MNFYWDMTNDDWLREQKWNQSEGDDFFGQCRIGDICFDFVGRVNTVEDEDVLFLDADCYVGGVDGGYGYGKDNYPYDYYTGFSFDDLLIGMTFEEFKKLAEELMTECINSEFLKQKASEPLHIW